MTGAPVWLVVVIKGNLLEFKTRVCVACVCARVCVCVCVCLRVCACYERALSIQQTEQVKVLAVCGMIPPFPFRTNDASKV
jgi:hypothetical protein